MGNDNRAWLTLAHAGISDTALTELLARFETAAQAIRQDRNSLHACGLTGRQCRAVLQPDESALDRALSWLEEPGHHIVCRDATDFPELLCHIPGPPTLIYVCGSVDVLHLPSLAIVGSRNPTRGGVSNAQEFASCLGRAGFSIVSGLAQGIDAAAHRGALSTAATTVAFLGHGIDRIYPTQNRGLAAAIVEGGALVSEYPLGDPPRRAHFPQRNRLISGISLGTLVIEAARRSGSLITARLAAEQGREVFAIPGSIHNPMSRGCHELIRQGAKLVETAQDIVSELGPLTDHLMQNALAKPRRGKFSDMRDKDYKSLIEVLAHDPATTDELVENSGLTIEQVSSMLLILELEGEIEALHGGQYSRLRSNSRQ